MSGLLAALVLQAASPASAAGDPSSWTLPTQPFHVAGPIYYVGTQGIGVYLIRTSKGLILLDGGLEASVPDVERSIAALGMQVHDIRIILATHGHFDHAGGLAQLKRDSGAVFIASAADRQAFDTGIPPSDTQYGVISFPAVKVDQVLADSRPVTLGGVALTPVLTPGHTPGCTTWTMRIIDQGKPLHVVFPCSMTVAGNKLIDNHGYPGIVHDFRLTFARTAALKADIVLPAHPEAADVLGRARRHDAGDRMAFVAPELLPRLVTEAKTAFERDLASANVR